MKPRHLVLSIDYEIFGNGSGDVRQHMVDPTDRMARDADAFAMPLTIYVEMEEYLAFERYSAELTRLLGYDPAALIRDQIRKLAAKGHDIQLHLHPQWHGATLVDGVWQLDRSRQTVDSLFATQRETTQYIAERKAALERLMGEVAQERPVVVYRAGAFSAQPGRKLIAALAANGFRIDSSVVKGLTHKNPHLDLDYRRAPSAHDPWRVSQDVAIEDASGPLWEMPIYSVMGRRIQQATWGRFKAKFSRNVPRNQQRDMVQQLGVGRNPAKVLKFLFQPVPIKLDFHNLSPRKLLEMIHSAPAPANPALPDVLVLIGHSKEHADDRAFGRFLELVAADSSLKVVGFGEVAAMMPKTGEAVVRLMQGVA